MKKNILFFAVFFLVAVGAQADQTLNGRQPREWSHSTEQKPLEGRDYQGDTTAVTNSVSTGHQATGNAGYLALVATGPEGKNHTYYLWVDGTANNGVGVLFMASFPNISTYSSFPYGDMRGTTFKAGAKVSGQ